MICFAKGEGNHEGCPYVDSDFRRNDGEHPPSPLALREGGDSSLRSE